MKVWPLLIVCQATGALHTEVAYNYSTAAFINCWEHFTAVRGHPGKVVSDKGSQLTSSRNTVAWSAAECPAGWDWDEVEARGARRGTEWVFVPPGAQFRNGLAEARVKAIKSTLDHVLTTALKGIKPTLNYAELVTVLSQAANIVNDRPVGVKVLTESDFAPITVNQLLLGRTSTNNPHHNDNDYGAENHEVSGAYQQHLLDTWWKLWKQQGFPTLLPYARLKDAQRHRNIEKGDICLVMYENQVKATYRLCRVLETVESKDDLVRTVKIGFRPRRAVTGKPAYERTALEELEVAVQRLVLLVPANEVGAEAIKVSPQLDHD